MYSCVSLNKRNIESLLELNKDRKEFNSQNEDFCEYYWGLSAAKQLFVRRNVKLLRLNNNIVGYIWFTKQDKHYFYLNSMFIKGEEKLEEGYDLLLKSLKLKSKLLYNCEKNSCNYNILSKLGFIKKEGTYDMHADIAKLNINLGCADDDIVFEQFIKGKHEDTRCKIQNEVFKNETRIPLTKDDICYDQIQSYYFEKGSVFIKKENAYVGYGQIIFNDNIATIVNVGILETYRSKGYGRALMQYLLGILKEQGIRGVNLKVSAENDKALKLYKSLGFNIKSESHVWEYKK